MDTSNFEAFNRISLYLLVKLFEEFPRKIDIDPSTLGLEAKPKTEREIYDEIWDDMTLAQDTLSWLQKEGFIDVGYATVGQKSTFGDVRLTLKGLTLLGYAPASPDKEDRYSNLAEKGKDILAEGGRGAAVDVIKQVLLGGLRYTPEAFS